MKARRILALLVWLGALVAGCITIVKTKGSNNEVNVDQRTKSDKKGIEVHTIPKDSAK